MKLFRVSKILKFFLLSILALGASCSTASLQLSSKDEIISIEVSESKKGALLPFIEVMVDSRSMQFLLDSGAVSSSIEADSVTSLYPTVGAAKSTGASGVTSECEVIQPKQFKIGSQVHHAPKLQRCHGKSAKNILGLDLLGKTIFKIDYAHKRLHKLQQLPTSETKRPLGRLSSGHVMIATHLGELPVKVLFDTGADTTVIDSDFVKKNPHLFTSSRAEEGTDANGNKIASQIFYATKFKIADIELTNVEMAAFDFGEHLRSKMEGAPVILGNNIISKGAWSFDLGQNFWTFERYTY